MPCDEKDVTLRYEGGGGFDVDQIAKAIQTKMTPDRVKARDDNLLKAQTEENVVHRHMFKYENLDFQRFLKTMAYVVKQ
jgi:hypothetical protein|tara:strand:+ start:67 stop:303 length:237 start_codon:yes stop_codon:yes gene_type:complete